MRLVELNNAKRSEIILLLFLVYSLGTVLFFILGSFYRNLYFVPDEKLYIQAAKAFANGDGLSYNGVNSTFQKIVYSIIISPAFLVKDLHIRIKLICLIGVLFEVSSIFPIYLISRKLNMDRFRSLIICVLSLSFPAFLFSMTFMSETAYLPLWLWTIYLIMLMLDLEKGGIAVPVILGVLSYILYMCKEVGIVALPALFLTELIYIIINKGGIKKMIPCFISIGVFLFVFLLGKFLIFGGVSSYYSYDITVPEIAKSSDKSPVYFFLYTSIYYLGYMILVNYVFPVFVRAKEKNLNQKITIYLEVVFLALIFVVVYRLSFREDYGLLSPRLHLRYFEPLFIPYTICLISRIKDLKEEELFKSKYNKLAFVVFLVAIIMLPGINSGGLLDSTTSTIYLLPEKIAFTLFLGSPRKTVILNIIMKLLIVLISLLEIVLIKKNKKMFIVVFVSIAIVINALSLTVKYIDIKKLYSLQEQYVDEMQEINDEIDSLPGEKLIIVNELSRLAEITITYYNVEHADIYLAEDEFEITDKMITLKAGDATRDVSVDDYDYVVYDNGLWEDAKESLPSDKVVLNTENFTIIEN